MKSSEIKEMKFKKSSASKSDLYGIASSILEKFDLYNEGYNANFPNDTDDSVKKTEKNTVTNSFLKDVKKFVIDEYEMGGFDIHIMNLKDESVVVMVNPNSEWIGQYFIGYISFYHSEKEIGKDTIKYIKVSWTDVASEYRGKGLAKALYSSLYLHASKTGYALASDSTLYEGAAGLWQNYIPSIAKHFGVIFDKVIIPLDDKEAKASKSNFSSSQVARFIAMEELSPSTNKIFQALDGLNYSEGEIGVFVYRLLYGTSVKISDKDILKHIKSENLIDLLKKINIDKTDIRYMKNMLSPKLSIKTMKAAVIVLQNEILILRENGKEIIPTSI